MKKILFGLLALSSLSFAVQTFHSTDKASIPVNLTVNVTDARLTQLRITDMAGINLNDLKIEHNIDTNFTPDHQNSTTKTFKVLRGTLEDGSGSIAIGAGSVTFSLATNGFEDSLWMNNLILGEKNVVTTDSQLEITNSIASVLNVKSNLNFTHIGTHELQSDTLTVVYNK